MTMLAEHLWQSTVIAFLAGVLAVLLRRERAAVRHAVWFTASVKFLVPFAALGALGEAALPALPASVLLAPAVVSSITQPLAEPIRRIVVLTEPATTGAGVFDFAGALAAIWLTGVIIFASVWWARWLSVARMVRQAVPITEGRAALLFQRLRAQSPVAQRLRLVASGLPVSPGIFGILRPVLIWPEGLTERLDDEQIDAVFRHEIEHLKRRDNLTALVHGAGNAFFWFHPSMWWIGSQLAHERERACDEAVLTSGHSRRAYAESILAACRGALLRPAGSVASIAGPNLRRRIERVMNGTAGRPLRGWRKAAVIAMAVLIVAAPIAGGLARPVKLGASFRPNLAQSLGLKTPSSGKPARTWLVTLQGPGGALTLQGFTLRDLIGSAYRTAGTPVLDGPAWIDAESIALTGQKHGDADESAALRALLEEALGLSVHLEIRNLPVYALVARDQSAGTGLRPADDCFDAAAWRAAGSPDSSWAGGGERRHFCATLEWGAGGIRFTGVTMADMAARLWPSLVDMRVVDATGLTGRYDAEVSFFGPVTATLRRFPQTRALFEPLGFPSFNKALRDQLGLELREAKAATQVLVIDQISRPSGAQ